MRDLRPAGIHGAVPHVRAGQVMGVAYSQNCARGFSHRGQPALSFTDKLVHQIAGNGVVFKTQDVPLLMHEHGQQVYAAGGVTAFRAEAGCGFPGKLCVIRRRLVHEPTEGVRIRVDIDDVAAGRGNIAAVEIGDLVSDTVEPCNLRIG